jgi:hypothetical protein
MAMSRSAAGQLCASPRPPDQRDGPPRSECACERRRIALIPNEVEGQEEQAQCEVEQQGHRAGTDQRGQGGHRLSKEAQNGVVVRKTPGRQKYSLFCI